MIFINNNNSQFRIINALSSINLIIMHVETVTQQLHITMYYNNHSSICKQTFCSFVTTQVEILSVWCLFYQT